MAYDPGQNPFQTGADNRFNSFTDPWNGVNANSGGNGWGMNPNLMTPSYMSPYRPTYQGSSGNPYQGYNPGFWTSANYLVNPFRGGGDNYGGQIYQQTNSFHNSLVNRPADSATNMLQQFVLPAALAYAAFKSPVTKFLGGMGTSLGQGLGFGMGSGFGMSAARTASMAKGLGAIGGFAMRNFSPFALASAGMGVIDSTMFNPYISQRTINEDLRDNFSGITFREGFGNSITGKGFSRGQAANFGRDLNVSGARDLTFSQKEYGQLASNLSRSGILDNVDGPQISTQLKSLIKQAKTVMSVLNTSDFAEVSSMMSKLAKSGVSLGDISKTVLTIGNYASAAGISGSKFMNTTGLQGQFLAQSNGLSPIAGMMVAGQNHAALGTAFRSGLISENIMARMGGVEGATQSATAGMIGGLQNPYINMMGMNSLYGKGEVGGVVGNISAFGGLISKDPVHMAGMSKLLQPAIVSNIMQGGNGALTLHKQLMHMSGINPSVLRNKSGGINASAAYMMMTQSMGMTDDQARAAIQVYGAASDPISYATQQKAYQNQAESTRLDWMRTHGKDYGIFTPAISTIKEAGRGILEWTSDNRGLELVGDIGDSIQRAMVGAKSGKRNEGITAEDLEAGMKMKSASTLVNYNGGRKTGESSNAGYFRTKDIAAINEASLAGKAGAVEFFKAKSYVQRKNAILHMAENGEINSRYLKEDNVEELLGTIGLYQVRNSGVSGEANFSKILHDNLNTSSGVVGKKGISEVESIELAVLSKKLSNLEGQGPQGKQSKEYLTGITRFRELVDPKYHGNVDNEFKRESLFKYFAETSDRAGVLGLMAAYDTPEKIGKLKKLVGDKTGKDAQKIIVDDLRTKGFNLTTAQQLATGYGGLTSQEVYGGTAGKISEQEAHAKLLQLRKENKIDTTEYYQMESALTMKDAVAEFSRAVQEFKGTTPGSSSSTSTERKPFLSEDSIKTMKSLPWIGHYFEPRR